MKTTYKQKLHFLIYLLFTQLMFSQLSKTHFIPPLTAAENGNAYPENQYFYISTPSDKDVSFIIKRVGLSSSFDEPYVVSKTSPQEIFIDSDYGQLFLPSNSSSQVVNDRGYIIEASDVIYVSVRMEAGEAQAGALVSKGVSALGNEFRIGTYTNENPSDNYLNFVTVMASEDNTIVNFSNLASTLVIKNYSGPIPLNDINLNKGESYTIALNSNEDPSNRTGLIGALVTSDKPIVVNCGSANGSFHRGGGRDYGIDQIVGADKIGTEYIFVKGFGSNDWENVLLVAHSDNTSLYINGNAVAETTINAGDYYLIEGDAFSSEGNMYVETSKPVFAYQGVGGLGNNGQPNEANQGMFFVPPLSCETRGNIDNIANIDKIGSEQYDGGVSIVTKKGALVTINGNPISSFSTVGPFDVPGNQNYITYKVTGLRGLTTSIECDDELYCAYFNYNGSATSGSFYSGFPSPPEINSNVEFDIKGVCLENGLELSVANPESFDQFEWYYNDGTGYTTTGEMGNLFIPTLPGTYKLIGTLSCSGNTFESSEIPIGHCPDDIDNDGIIDNLDIDNDNDGIKNCDESFGNQNIDLSNLNSGSLPVSGITFSGNMTPLGNATSSALSGDSSGNFKSELPAKSGIIETSSTYDLTFGKKINLSITYPTATFSSAQLLSDDAELIFSVNEEKTITLTDPDDQLLIDTNYDGVYESGITQFSSFKIYVKLKDNTPLELGSGTFQFYSDSIDEFTFVHKTTSETETTAAVFNILATCVPKDSDNDNVNDAFDFDSDNDGISDRIENTGKSDNFNNTDANFDGYFDVYETITTLLDSDEDSYFDFYDLDSDNDGIYDLYESGGGLLDANFDGIIDNIENTIGINGWDDNAETSPDSGIIDYSLQDTDTDLLFNYIDSDSDGDTCFDVTEAGFTDADMNGNIDGTGINQNGTITGSDGYLSIPHSDYITTGIITIDTPPTAQISCELDVTIFEIETNTIDNYQWEVSTDDGASWNSIIDDANFQNSASNKLTILNTPLNFNNSLFRVLLEKKGNSCGEISEEVSLTVNPLPIIVSSVELTQCDDDTNDKISFFNLNEANNKILPGFTDEVFTFFTDATAVSNEILNATAFEASDGTIVYARATTVYGCSRISEIKLNVEPTQLSSSFFRNFYQCDDFLDTDGNDTENNNKRDGVSSFNFESVTADIYAELGSDETRVTITYFENQEDALAEENKIDPSNYRNKNYPLLDSSQPHQIYVRIDSKNENACIGLGPHVNLYVEKLPIANPVTIERQCDDDLDGTFLFNTSHLESELLNGQTDVTITYFDASGNPLKDFNGNPITSPFPNQFLTSSQIITVQLNNNSTNAPDGPCYDETSIEFIVDKKPIAYPVEIAPVCDDESNDGLYEFDTSLIESTILGTQQNMEVHYFDENGNELPSPLPNPFNTTSKTISVEVINTINNSCTAATTIDFIVNPLPDFDVETHQILCITEPPSSLELEIFPYDRREILTYLWKAPNGVTSTEKTFTATVAGSYFVTVTKTDGTNCSRTREIIVENSEAAKIGLEDVIIVDDSRNNTISIIKENNNLGIGDYEFSLNDNFSFQDEPFFDYVEPGIHTIFVRDINGCTTSKLDVSVLAFPKFFTPDGNYTNDTWNIKGIDPSIYPKVLIHIFDRFGKLLKSFNPYSEEWDGRFNGQVLPATDYWFSAELTNYKNEIRIKKGHFSLIRK